jgi:DNA helicase HerA-like ATPase
MIPEVDRYSGMYVLGMPGMGKSAYLENLIHQDAEAGRAIVVVDPHGDLVDHVLAAIPQHRIAQTFVLDLLDEQFPYGINPFAAFKTDTEVDRSHASAKIEHMFEVLWAGSMDQQFLPRFVRAVTFMLLDNPGSTLVDVFRLLEDDDYRATMVANVTDPSVRRFWEREFDRHGESERMRRISPLIGRLERLFLGKALVRNVVGQRVLRSTSGA